jgi:hypothetical protein
MKPFTTRVYKKSTTTVNVRTEIILYHAILSITTQTPTYLIDNIRAIHLRQGLLAQMAQVLREAFQHFLMVLKAFLLKGLRLIHVVCKRVRVLEHPSAFHQLLVGSLEELHVGPLGILRRLLQQHHALFSLLELAFGKRLGFRVSVVALVVVQVSIKFALCLGGVALIAGVVRVKLVALVVPSRVGAVVMPLQEREQEQHR